MRLPEPEALAAIKEAAITVYNDPVLMRHAKVYGRFCKDLHQKHLITYAVSAKEYVGIFVSKRKWAS